MFDLDNLLEQFLKNVELDNNHLSEYFKLFTMIFTTWAGDVTRIGMKSFIFRPRMDQTQTQTGVYIG
jgi:hypothetical protein